MRNALKWSALFLLCAAVAAVAVFAQSTGGGLQGKVTDASGQPVIGATIKVTGPAVQGFLGAATDINGEYRIPFVPAGKNYTVQVEAQGFNSVVRSGIEIPLGTTISLPFQLGQGTSTITVVGAAPIIDVKKAETGATISDTMINAIPMGRGSSNIAYLSPGAVSSGLAGAPAINGASGPENSYLVNGIEVVGSADGLNNMGLNFDFIEATEVKTGGLDAEYGGLMGGQINQITKAGGNEFHGGIFMYYFDSSWAANSRTIDNPEIISNNPGSMTQWDLGGFLGGYIVKDKLWFFTSYDYNKTKMDFNPQTGTDPNLYLNGQPAWSWARATGYENNYRDPQYAMKLTWNVNQNHKLSLSFFGDRYNADTWANRANFDATAAPYNDNMDNYGATLQWNATWTPKFFTEVVIGTRRSFENTTPKNAAAMNNWGYYYRFSGSTYGGYQVDPNQLTSGYGTTWEQTGNGPNTDPANWTYDPASGLYLPASGSHLNLISGYTASLGGRTYEYTTDMNDQLRIKATNLFNVGKTKMELSYGVQYFDITYNYNFNYTGPGVTNAHAMLYDPSTGQFVPNPWLGETSPGGAIIRFEDYWYGDLNGNGQVDPNEVKFRYRAQYFMNDQNKHTEQKYYAYWAQDNWSLTDYFMLKLGVRLDQIHMDGQQNTVNIPHNLEIAKYGSDPYNMANGSPRHVRIDDEWAPRVGFTWDVAHNGKSKLYGFYGQYYERIPNDMAIRALTDEYFTFERYNDAALTIPTSVTYAYGTHPTQIQGGPGGGKLKGSYNEEWILGFQYEIASDFTMGARAIYRSLGRVIEDISLDQGMTYIITNPDQWAGYFEAAPRNGVWGMYTFPKPTRIYRGLEITADKRFSNHWQMGGSYVLSRLEGNYEGLFSNDNGQLDPNITSKYDLPSLLVNAYGLLPNDRTHVLHLYGSYSFDWGLDLGANFTLMSGTPISKLGADDMYGTNEGFCAPRGEAGRTPTIWSLDASAQYNLKLFKTNLGLRVDVFNVTNQQTTTAVDQTWNNANVSEQQNWPYWGMETAHQQERRIRVAVRWTF
jgi:hypothetical protein